ncbi:hypothetical protein IRB23M11_15160 [Alkalibacterium sp. m-11]|uniref:nuclease-related domain-containing protein n=1 Tax=Alkalibacterium indicireducens TaxID=398758 RepID=UPI0031F84963
MQLKILNQLAIRKGLNPEDNDYRNHLIKGFEGEQKFDKLLDELNDEHLIMQDLSLEINRQTFQIDAIVITGNKIMLFEIKNYQGEYTFHENELKSYPYGNIILNPLSQLNRSCTLLRMLLEKIDINSPIEGQLVFINDFFVLYRNVEQRSLLLPQQIRKYIIQMNKQSVPVRAAQKACADRLLRLHKTEDRYIQVPEYTFEDLNKGVYCPKCSLTLRKKNRRTAYCPHCGFFDLNTRIISNEIKTFSLLFPDYDLKTSVIYDWCGTFFTKDSIQRTLAKEYIEKGSRKGTYYVKE